MTLVDIAVLVFYFVLMLAIGFVFKNKSTDTKNYFAGGGMMLWWMVGATTFMTQFSAWSYTGGAGQVYSSGFLVVAIQGFGNALAFYLASIYFAEKYRQLRVVTPMEVMHKRFGRVTEQTFTWLQIPSDLISAGIWINAVAVFAGGILGVDISMMVVITGATVVLLAVIGGSWAVVASDFVQALIVTSVSVAATVYAFVYVGGFEGLSEKLPEGFHAITGPESAQPHPVLYWMFIVLTFVRMIVSNNSVSYSFRLMTAKDSRNAKKGARFAAVLQFFGPFIWFFPPVVVATMFTDDQMKEMYSALGSHYRDAAFAAFVQHAMPVGMVGLMMAGAFAATMSSMDSSISKNAGILTRNFYLPIVKNGKCGETELVIVGKTIQLVIGAVVIGFGLFIASIKQLSLFDIMMQANSLIQLPIWVPLFWVMLIKRIPSWAPWATVVFGFCISLIVKSIVTPENVAWWWGFEFTKREMTDFMTTAGVFSQLTLTSLFMFCTKMFYKESDVAQVERDRDFWETANTPVVNNSIEANEVSADQGEKMSKLCFVYGLAILLLFLVPQQTFGDHFIFIGISACVIGFGLFLKKQAAMYRHRNDDVNAEHINNS